MRIDIWNIGSGFREGFLASLYAQNFKVMCMGKVCAGTHVDISCIMYYDAGMP